MKKFMYIQGMVVPAMLITGTIFKIQHWPGAGIMLRSDTENQGAVNMEGNIIYHRIEKKDQLYNVKVGIFGDEGIPGKGEVLLRRINEYREFRGEMQILRCQG